MYYMWHSSGHSCLPKENKQSLKINTVIILRTLEHSWCKFWLRVVQLVCELLCVTYSISIWISLMSTSCFVLSGLLIALNLYCMPMNPYNPSSTEKGKINNYCNLLKVHYIAQIIIIPFLFIMTGNGHNKSLWIWINCWFFL